MRTQIATLLTKIVWVLFLGIFICQWSCVEDINPREIAPSEVFSPPHEHCVQPDPIVERPGQPKSPEITPSSRRLSE